MARALYATIVLSFCATMLWLGVRHGVFNAFEAAAIATLAGGLAWAWVTGKKNIPPSTGGEQ